ncbi:hypothetical protein TcG_09128 [Trypanosoma cruzi]|nr:hypothetical protein TcG_09128 [Trypanosoma cruzi]
MNEDIREREDTYQEHRSSVAFAKGFAFSRRAEAMLGAERFQLGKKLRQYLCEVNPLYFPGSCPMFFYFFIWRLRIRAAAYTKGFHIAMLASAVFRDARSLIVLRLNTLLWRQGPATEGRERDFSGVRKPTIPQRSAPDLRHCRAGTWSLPRCQCMGINLANASGILVGVKCLTKGPW